MAHPRTITSILVLAGLALLAGCGGDDPVTPDPGGPQSALPFPDSPDQLIANFKGFYDGGDAGEAPFLLASAFRCFLQAGTRNDFSELGEDLDLNEAAGMHERMFGGEPGHDANGDLVAPVASIACFEPIQLEAWAPAGAETPLPGATAAMFTLGMDFLRLGDKSLQVRGQVRFYITVRDSLHQGEIRPYHQILGLEDFTLESKDAADSQDTAYGTVLALFR